ncbi:hypothetical protein BXT86_01965 [candidate division WOR-3 bacterium 4484_100]|uniref:Rubrerythrin diiron-binding domain-containing protein n=1 Tax=candidate division WOR-3 bacterium 4484_100 TaxID=1936077 RepID=A0A1V4QG53_UNCW3|nr:MAG: hypothetical protein BXT86_01965 [candidate division WOR-3 bacterium 4484_100]
MALFKPDEIFQFAIRIEENGEKFYRAMADKFDDPKLKETFSYLADEEIKHKRLYEDMATTVEKYEPFETYPEEYFAYMRAYADTIIFSPDKIEEKIEKISDPGSALEFAIATELDSILYYQEVKNLVSEKRRSVIDKIVDEERRHFVKLTDLKKEL